ncbi:Hypothetical protein CM240_1659 [Clostridium bornimense]|uniref:Glycosyltransferase 2-like domain-containing protein n=1 Tax=Clostridium bornimense TaxID=1216932 RepID=W6S3B6_9CLOT|nr:glycosyltransferase [Clostridium bornimense]CDM68817.1 Hypothetical protein CM240_1659 [Clostridium bornimense]
MNKRISIIVLTYNNFKYYKECIDSILCQTYSDIEIVISDDGSLDFPRNEIYNYIYSNISKNIKKITININEHNLGIVKNYNKAIRLSEGDYIFYLAIDDVLYDKNVIKDVVNYFEETGELIFTGYKDVYNSDLNEYIKTLPRDNEVEILKKKDARVLYESLCKGSFISGSNTPFSKNLIDKYGYLDESYCYLEDYPRYLSLTKRGCNIGFYDRKLIKYRSGGVTTSGKISDVLRRDIRRATIEECSEYFQEKWNHQWIIDKKLIGWGTGDCYKNSTDYIKNNIDYLVDSNKSIQKTKIEGKLVLSPEVLLKEDINNIFILIFSYANYFDIAKCLEEYGFKEYKHFFVCTPNILEII